MITHPVLHRLAMSGIKLGLDRVKEFLQILGEPHQQYAVIHVAGTNGKGSTVAMIARVLEDAGFSVGANHSPHTSHLNERIWIDGKPVEDADLSEILEELDRERLQWAESAGISGEPLTYFEMITCAAFLMFARRKVDIAVIETGLGGRLDATNVVTPLITAVTTVGLDHQAELGSKLEEIAEEKAGIFKKSATAVIGPMPNIATAVFERRARALHIDLWKPGTELRRTSSRRGWSFSTPDGSIDGLSLGLVGAHQGANASVAFGVLHQLRRHGFPVPDSAIRTGFARAWLPGRLEELRPGLIVDGAHNRQGMEALARWLARRDRPHNRIVLFGMGEGRNVLDVVQPLFPHIDELVTTKCAHPKAINAKDLATRLQDGEVLLAYGSTIEDDLVGLYEEADELIITGSLYLTGAVRTLVEEGILDEGKHTPAE